MTVNGGSIRCYRIFGYEIKDNNYLKTLVLSASLGVTIFLPFIIGGRGIFLFHGDFNAQQIPFWQYCHQAVRSGDVFWSHFTDLGSPFIASYSFYVIGSPFFWLTLPFPSSFCPYLMGPLLIIKISTAAVLAYAYIKRFVDNRNWAVIGSLLYAFSSFTIHNVFYNHFIDVIALFPLLLISMEELITKGRKGVFALSVALCAITNYFFFVGQAVFLILYFILRSFSSDFKVTFRRFLCVFFEAVLGVALASFILLPSFLLLMDNSRASSFIPWGLGMLYHGNLERYAHLVQSVFMMTDMPTDAPNFFPTSNFKWASVAAYLPFFGMAGVIAFLKDFKRHWLKRLIVICMIALCVPILNSIFFALNAEFFARWLYMPILGMCLATAVTLDQHRITSLKLGFWYCIGFTIIFVFTGLVLEYAAMRRRIWSADADSLLLIVPIAVTLVSSVIGVIFMSVNRKDSARYIKRKGFFTAVVISILICSYFQLWKNAPLFVNNTRDYENYVTNGIDMAGVLDLPDAKENLYRIDFESSAVNNQPMYWGQPSIKSFHSVLPSSVVDFYRKAGVTVYNNMYRPHEYYGFRGLLSVKHLFVQTDMEFPYKMPGFEYARTVGNFSIYNNMYYVPLGFTFDYYVDYATIDDIDKDDRHLLFCKALVLDETQAERYTEYIKKHPQFYDADASIEGLRTTDINTFTADAYITDCINASIDAAESFVIDNTGFTAQISLASSKLVFFSVPYDSGWNASVNGEMVQVEKVSYGFMAVPAPAGTSEIRFDYDPPGLRIGLYIGLGSAVVLAIYAVVIPRARRGAWQRR